MSMPGKGRGRQNLVFSGIVVVLFVLFLLVVAFVLL